MHLIRLHVHRVRNLQKICFLPHPGFNIFCGKNGSGKTSLLEAIHILALGRSFRSRQIQSVITYEEDTLACFGEIQDGKEEGPLSLGIEKNREGEVRCKIQGESCAKLSQFAQRLPLQLMTPETFKLLSASASERRKFIDWGVFHVEHTFGTLCQRYQRLLKQRNAALKPFSDEKLRIAWEKELAIVGEQIAQYRETYIAELLPFILEVQSTLFPELSLDIRYERGWEEGQSLEMALHQAITRDKRYGFTTVGPHRAEITFTFQSFLAHQVLSRGQQKLLIAALHVAQTQTLSKTTGKKCLYLMDDLASELDNDNRHKVLQILGAQNHQVFFTGTDSKDWEGFQAYADGKMFHVEQGQIR